MGQSIVGINGGVRAHTTQDILNTLLNHPGYQSADIVILMENINDRLLLATRGYYVADLSNDSPTTLTAVQSSSGELVRSIWDSVSFQFNILFLVRSYASAILSPNAAVTERNIDFHDESLERSLRMFRKNLSVFVKIVLARGGIPVLMTQAIAKDSIGQDQFNDTIRSVAVETGTALIDLASELPEKKESLFFADMIHLNNQGSIAVAEIISQHLSSIVKDLTARPESVKAACKAPTGTGPPTPTRPKLLIEAPGRYPVMAFSEDWVLFQQQVNKRWHLATYNIKSHEYKMLSSNRGTYDDRHGMIINDGIQGTIRIVFGSNREGEERLYIMDLSSGVVRPLTALNDGSQSIPGPTRQGEKVYFAGQNADREFPDLFEYDLANEMLRQITKTEWEEWRPVVSPDGRYLYYIANPLGNFDIFRKKLPNGSEERIYGSPADEWDPQISGDGRWLTFASSKTGNWDIYLLDLTRSDPPIQLTTDTSDDWDPTFTPMSHAVVFASSKGGDPHIYILCPFGET